MKLTIIGATGGIGRQLVTQSLAAGHDVTAVARNPRDLPAGAHTATVDFTDPDPGALAAAVKDTDGVLSTLGPRRPRAEAGIASRGTRALIAAMAATGVRRIVVVSAAPVGPVPDPGDGFLMRHLGSPLARALLRAHYDDLALMEQLLRDSGLDWTVSRPPRLTNGPLTGRYRTAFGRNIRGGVVISRADVAHQMLAALVEPETIGQIVGIAR
ncbi:MAG TPA: SDR family oxidoreductase [Rugosimonospora sp.]|nr:SDR family oxidoreductase [Rugosimonospora sp.]